MDSAATNINFDAYTAPVTGSRWIADDDSNLFQMSESFLVPSQSKRNALNDSDDYANVTPGSIRSNWHALKDTPEPLLNSIYQNATFAESLKPNGRPGLLGRSLETFLMVWRLVSAFAGLPVLSVTPKGYLIAEWYSDRENALTMMFSGNGRVHYSLFNNGRPCEGYEDDPERYAELVRMLTSRDTNPFLWSDF